MGTRGRSGATVGGARRDDKRVLAQAGSAVLAVNRDSRKRGERPMIHRFARRASAGRKNRLGARWRGGPKSRTPARRQAPGWGNFWLAPLPASRADGEISASGSGREGRGV